MTILYGAHDVTIVNFLNGLDLISTKCLLDKFKSNKYSEEFMEGCPRGPRYASNLIIELYRKE